MQLPEIEQLLARSIGLDSNSIGISAVDRAVRERMRISRVPSIESYWEYLRDSSAELQELIETVVVPETWFFRDEESFATLIRTTLELQERTSATLRFLSIPCSTGEEPYSIAMALRDAGIARGRFHVDAVDISGRVLAHARRGIYGRNSFRSHNLAFRERYFRPVSEGYALVESISSAVSFHQGNVVPVNCRFLHGPYDAIYCRNLLIYLDRPAQARVLQTLSSLLAPDGMLFVGPVEAFFTSANGFSAVGGPASFAFKKCQSAPRQPEHVAPPSGPQAGSEKPALQQPLASPDRQLFHSASSRLRRLTSPQWNVWRTRDCLPKHLAPVNSTSRWLAPPPTLTTCWECSGMPLESQTRPWTVTVVPSIWIRIMWTL